VVTTPGIPKGIPPFNSHNNC